MQKRVLILHGYGGSSYPHWQAVLASDLIKENIVVSFPSFPYKFKPNLKQWKEFLKEEIKHFKPNIVICHSLANVLWLHTCDELDIELEKLLLVAPASSSTTLKAIKSFFPFEIPKSLKAKHSFLIGSSNDEHMSEEEAKTLANDLNIPYMILQDGGHINAKSGFGKFDFVYDFINEEKE